VVCSGEPRASVRRRGGGRCSIGRRREQTRLSPAVCEVPVRLWPERGACSAGDSVRQRGVPGARRWSARVSRAPRRGGGGGRCSYERRRVRERSRLVAGRARWFRCGGGRGGGAAAPPVVVDALLAGGASAPGGTSVRRPRGRRRDPRASGGDKRFSLSPVRCMGSGAVVAGAAARGAAGVRRCTVGGEVRPKGIPLPPRGTSAWTLPPGGGAVPFGVASSAAAACSLGLDYYVCSVRRR